jgi:hypothetical protein
MDLSLHHNCNNRKDFQASERWVVGQDEKSIVLPFRMSESGQKTKPLAR